MKPHIKGKYSIATEVQVDKELEIDLEAYLIDKLTEYEYPDLDSLEDIIKDYIFWDNFELCLNSKYDHVNYVDDSEDLEIVNLVELVEKYSYLIPPQVELTCCEKAINASKSYKTSYNFCPTCGKSIR